jgi:hypothetical protein
MSERLELLGTVDGQRILNLCPLHDPSLYLTPRSA